MNRLKYKNNQTPYYSQLLTMDFDIKIGTQSHQTKIIEKKDTAIMHESGLAKVFATPAMIALMEKTAFTSIEAFLPDSHSSVGIEVKAQHLRASLPGSIITCESTVIRVEGKKVTFELSAFDENGIIGKAEHTRFIIDTKEFMARLNQKNELV
ncbi:MAG: thioesterase family protein [Salinivirgaceae bacterium]|jgi:fluoroacetyl-CoA thioesterase|nr:thioesterase family protein [Salinivirgaceae bacterium]